MASRGRRGGASAREDEPQRDEQAEQQAPAPRGPVLPPPPPVDYRVFMQGLVQAMQMQAHTQAALQAQLEAQCGSSDHKIKDCPRLQQGAQRGAPAPAVAAAAPATRRPGMPRAPARVFALAREDAEQAEHVIEGTVLLLGVHARVLFDTGATHSFISEQFARQLALESGVESEELEVPLSVHTPAGTVSTRKCIPSLPVCIEDRILDGCFFLLKMKDYDAILGLDWLEEHYALVDCRRKKTIIQEPGGRRSRRAFCTFLGLPKEGFSEHFDHLEQFLKDK
ncbi:hypothetical protein Taro_019149 [Colocasia esculenta]|uniref:Gag protease polyprotein n=1 Tax=Colocasia esculenta TaxID=4460 RepID=A0A843UYC2_COLES|nr:hypothetical protein [Colocasia esculenta]